MSPYRRGPNILPVDLHMMAMRKDVGCVGNNDIMLHFLQVIKVCPKNKTTFVLGKKIFAFVDALENQK